MSPSARSLAIACAMPALLTTLLAASSAAAQVSAAGTAQRVSEWDANGDGTLSLDEFTTEARAAFDAIDDDRNGNVSVEELDEAAPQAEGGLSAAHRIALIDGDEDGALALDEYEDDVESLFEALDADDSGQLEPGELRSGWVGRLPRP